MKTIPGKVSRKRRTAWNNCRFVKTGTKIRNSSRKQTLSNLCRLHQSRTSCWKVRCESRLCMRWQINR